MPYSLSMSHSFLSSLLKSLLSVSDFHGYEGRYLTSTKKFEKLTVLPREFDGLEAANKESVTNKLSS